MVFLIYKITNLIDNRIYIGAHATTDVNDNYFGSGSAIKKDIKKLGRQNFRKEILHVFDNKEDMMNKEREIVTKEFCHREDTYNYYRGGANNFSTIDMTCVKDKEGNSIIVYKNDPRYLSGELQHVTKGTITVQDKEGKYFRVDKNDERVLSGELVGHTKGKIPVVDKDGNKFSVDKTDERYLNGELKGIFVGKGNKDGEVWKGRKHSEETRKKQSEKAKLLTGEKNSSFGTMWITKENQNKKIKKTEYEVYLSDGWIKGRK